MSHRRARVQKELRMRIAEILGQRARDPRLRGVQVLEVRASPDFSYARVFYRPLEGGAPNSELASALEAARGFVRSELARAMQIRRIPELDFRFDDAPERAARIYDLLASEGEDEGRASGAQAPRAAQRTGRS